MAPNQSLPKKIAVLMGGPGSERDVSLATGRGVSKALHSLGAEVLDVDVHDENFALPKDVDLDAVEEEPKGTPHIAPDPVLREANFTVLDRSAEARTIQIEVPRV